MAVIPVQKSSSIKTAVRGNQCKPTLVLVAKSIPCRRPWLCSHCPSIQSCRLFAWRSWAGPMQAPTAPNQRAESCGMAAVTFRHNTCPATWTHALGAARLGTPHSSPSFFFPLSFFLCPLLLCPPLLFFFFLTIRHGYSPGTTGYIPSLVCRSAPTNKARMSRIGLPRPPS
ncbi:hypothetical protein BC940DRAFT_56997 [Gongronella butleri]|nr:hypothetical protein BC940DRAFT_56997 [Gongronella butleri]